MYPLGSFLVQLALFQETTNCTEPEAALTFKKECLKEFIVIVAEMDAERAMLISASLSPSF